MEFNSKICTTKEQSERLIRLGLKKATADCILVENPFEVNEYIMFPLADDNDLEDDIPAWSLHRLIVLSGMGIIESSTDNLYDKVIQYIEYLIKCGNFNKEYLEE